MSENEENSLLKAFNKLVRWLFAEKKTEINPEDISHKNVMPLFEGINTILQQGYEKGIQQNVPDTLKKYLSDNVFIFSGAKTYAELKELSSKLLDEKGNQRTFSKYWKEVQSTHTNYNKKYLQAEYLFATQSAQQAANWHEIERDGDRYLLQYRTAGDGKVRPEHAILHNTTLPHSDPFWRKFYPPNGWRCRCKAQQVRKTKYAVSDSDSAVKAAEKATAGKNEIFRFNPGKNKIIFPADHPYITNLSKEEKNTLNKLKKDKTDE